MAGAVRSEGCWPRNSLRCCRIWTSGSGGWCWARRRARWATAGSRRSRRAAGLSAVTVSKGVAELEAGEEPLGRTRRPGGGRKSVTETDPGLIATLLSLVEPGSRGDPESPLRWTTKSVRRLAEALAAAGHKVSAPTVAKLLRAQGFSLQANVQDVEGGQHPDRDAQFPLPQRPRRRPSGPPATR